MAAVLGITKVRFSHLKAGNEKITGNELARFKYFFDNYSTLPKELIEDCNSIAEYILKDLDNAAKLDQIRPNKLSIENKAALYTMVAHIMEHDKYYNDKFLHLNTFMQILSSKSYEYLFYFITFANKLNLSLDSDYILHEDSKELQEKMEALIYVAVQDYFKVSTSKSKEQVKEFKNALEMKKTGRRKKKDMTAEKIKKYRSALETTENPFK